MNVSLIEDNIEFYVSTSLNETLATYPEIPDFAGVGVQVMGDLTDHAGPLTPIFPINAPSGGFWTVFYDSPPIEVLDYTVKVNITLWHDFEKNGTWALTEEWIFNLELPTAEETEYVPNTYNGLELGFIWFWVAFGSLFFTAISLGAAVKKVSLKYGLIALLSGLFTYAFFMIIAAGG